MANINDVSNCLISAVREGVLETVRDFIDTYGLSYSPEWSKGYSLLCLAIENGHTKIIMLLLDHDAEVNHKNSKRFDTPLHLAVLNRCIHIEIVKMLLERHADVNAVNERGKTPLHIAVSERSIEFVYHLLKHGANVNVKDSKDKTPLYLAVLNRPIDFVYHLLKHGANVNVQDFKGITPLHLSVFNRPIDFVHLLIKHGANVKGEFPMISPLIHAINRPIEFADLLLKHGAYTDARDNYGNTTLHIAVSKRLIEFVDIVLKYGADVNIEDRYGKTPLHHAVSKSFIEGVDLLIRFGADVNCKSLDGITPLLRAVLIANHHENSDIVKHLLLYGAKADIKDNMNYTALQIATVNNHASIIKAILGCEVEIERIKRKKIGCSNISFHDILTKSINQLSVYATNENVVAVLKSGDYKKYFPLYASMIKNRFKIGANRRKLINQIIKLSYSYNFNFNKLPSSCSEHILSYLSNKDLQTFCSCL